MLIAMAGLPGSGKSTLARGLAAEIGGAVLDKDVVRAALFAPADIEHSTQQNDFCVGIMLRVAAYLWKVKPQRVVLLDGRTFSRRSQRDEVAAFAAQHGRPFRLIACVCSDETARRRTLPATGTSGCTRRSSAASSRSTSRTCWSIPTTRTRRASTAAWHTFAARAPRRAESPPVATMYGLVPTAGTGRNSR